MTHKSLKVGAGGIFVIPFMKMEETLNIKIGIELGVCRRQSTQSTLLSYGKGIE